MLVIHRLIVMKMAEQPVMIPGPVFDLLQKVCQPIRLGIGEIFCVMLVGAQWVRM